MPLNTSLELPKVVEIEPTHTCNLRCRMCHVSFMPDEPRETLDPDAIDRLAALRGVYFVIGSGFEPMMNRDFAEIVRKLTALNGKIELITNGTLLSKDNVHALLDADLKRMTFSFDGIKAETYEHIRRRSNYQHAVDAIVAFRRKFAGRDTLFCINSTIMRRNLDEVSETVDFWDAADFDGIGFITMVVRTHEPELIRESLFPVRDEYHARLDAAALDVIEARRRVVLGSPWFQRTPLRKKFPANFHNNIVASDHPGARVTRNYRQHTQLGAGPGMTFPCKSPWTFARILPNADVQLCYQFTVGNLKTQRFEEIWFGPAANAVRDKVRTEQALCESCDYFRFCLRNANVNDDDKETYFAGELLSRLETVDFESGIMEKPEVVAPPELIESMGAFNIVRFRGSYLGVPQSLGPLDLASVRYEDLPGLVVSPSLREARKAIESAIDSR